MTIWLAIRVVACGIGLIAFGANAQKPGTGGEAEPSRCLSEATVEVTATPSQLTWPDSSVVEWTVELPTACHNVEIKLNGQPVGASGSRTVNPPASSIFRVTISETHLGVFQQKSASASIAVRYPPLVVIHPDTQDPVAVLLGALASSNSNPQQTIELCDVDLDLTGHIRIEIGDYRRLIASSGCARSPRRLGPRIFVTDERGRAPLFLIIGDNVLVSGFRLEGPTDFIAQGDRKEKGILVDPAEGASPLRSVEISNMEIFHWSGVGIQVVDNVTMAIRGRLFNTNPGAVRVKGNYFHHNRHGAGEGYGVASTAGAYLTIEQNVFDENRHGIAGGSKHDDAEDYSGYTARDNLILADGGVHCLDSPGTGAAVGGVIGGIVGGLLGGGLGAGIGAAIGAGVGAVVGSTYCWQTHQIDMHGTKSTRTGGHACCGTAGETMMIERNTILYTKGLAIKIRGNPTDKVVVDGNVFMHENHRKAIKQNGEPGFGDNISNPIDVRPNNEFGVDDPTTELGSCDFFGDGQQDQFMATGVTWWARSPVTGQWRYLNTMSERLPQLQLGNVDNDGKCDVAVRPPSPVVPPRKYSKNGMGPWVPVQVIEQ